MTAGDAGEGVVAVLASPDDFDGWRAAVRAAVLAEIDPARLSWRIGADAGDLFGGASMPTIAADAPAFGVPRDFVQLARTVLCHSDPERFALLHQALLRVRADRRWLEDRADPLNARLDVMARAVRRDIHKMRAFVRFRALADDAGERYVAWYEPAHHIGRVNARFFVERFTTMRWSILMPELSLHWDGAALTEGPGATRADAPAGDPVEGAWKRYYASIFNPARVKVGAMLKEMPKKYWANMPETALIPDLLASAQAREAAMIDTAPDPDRAPGGNISGAWHALKSEALACTRCPLHLPATQTVFGEGPPDAALMFVGEQPGDQEDLAGRPFVGPAGQLFDQALAAAGIDRAGAYVTNSVKHFKFVARGKRRIHEKPGTSEISACRWWLEQERALVRPRVIVALGATATQAITGKAMPIGKSRGQAWPQTDGSELWVTVHPSYLLRLPDPALAATERERFVADLVMIRDRVAELTG